jgi:hypothetical protein
MVELDEKLELLDDDDIGVWSRGGVGGGSRGGGGELGSWGVV